MLTNTANKKFRHHLSEFHLSYLFKYFIPIPDVFFLSVSPDTDLLISCAVALNPSVSSREHSLQNLPVFMDLPHFSHSSTTFPSVRQFQVYLPSDSSLSSEH